MRNQQLARKVMFLVGAGSQTSELDTTNTILYFYQNIESGVFVNGKCMQTFLEEVYSDEIVGFAYVR